VVINNDHKHNLNNVQQEYKAYLYTKNLLLNFQSTSPKTSQQKA